MNVPINRLIAHPDRTSNHSKTLRDKLKRHIHETSLYPPLIVRSLGKSNAFPSNNGTLQIIDGHLRFDILKELNAPTVNVVNFGALTDEQTHVLLLTLNRLRAHDSVAKRAELLKTCAKKHKLDLAQLQRLLPDTKSALTRLLNLAAGRPKIHTSADPKKQPRPFAVFLKPSQHQLIDHAVKSAKSHFKLASISEALETISRNFLHTLQETPHAPADIPAQSCKDVSNVSKAPKLPSKPKTTSTKKTQNRKSPKTNN